MHDPTCDHIAIQLWAERHDARPARSKPYIFDSEPTILRFVFGDERPFYPEITLISWEAFFELFDLMKLLLRYDETPWYELLQPDRVSIYRSLSD